MPYYPEEPNTTVQKSEPYYPPGPSGANLPKDIADERAKDYHQVLEDNSPGPAKISEQLQTGNDEGIRELAVYHKQQKTRAAKQEVIDKLVQSGSLAPDSAKELIQGIATDDFIPSDSVMEVEGAKKALSATLYAGDNPTLDAGLAANPDRIHARLDAAENLLAIKRGIQKRKEDLEADIGEQGTLSYAWDVLRSSFLPFSQWQDINSAIGASSTAPLGSALEEERQRILSLPADEAITRYNEVMDRLVEFNRQDAISFADSMLKYTSTQKAIDNILVSGGDLTTFGLIKPVVSGVKAVTGLAKGAAKTVTKGAEKAAEATVEAEAKGVAKGAEGLSKPSYMSQAEWEQIQKFKQAREAGLSDEDAYNASKATPEMRAEKAIDDTLKGQMHSKTDPAEALAMAGHSREAAEAGAKDELRQMFNTLGAKFQGGLRGAGAPSDINAIKSTMPTVFDPEGYVVRAGKTLTLQKQRQIVKEVTQTDIPALEALSKGVKIERMNDSEEMLNAMVKQAADRIEEKNGHELAQRVLDLKHQITQTPAGDVHRVDAYIGDQKNNFYTDPNIAVADAHNMGFTDKQFHTIYQQGKGYAIVLSQNVDETDPVLRKLIMTNDNQTPRSYATMFLGGLAKLRSADDLVSAITRQDRATAIFGQGELTNYLQKLGERIGGLGKTSRKDLLDFLDADKIHEFTDEKGVTHIGRFADTLAELDDRWYSMFGRPITDKEAVAYMEYRRLNEIDWAYRNFRGYRDLARAGIEQVEVMPGLKIQAKYRKEGLPIDDPHPFTVLYFKKGQPPKLYASEAMTDGDKAFFKQLREEGAKAYAVNKFGRNALLKDRDSNLRDIVGDEVIDFVVGHDFRVDQLPLKVLPSSPGGHIKYPDGHYVSQPSFAQVRGKMRYNHDVNVFHTITRAQGKQLAEDLETVRQMLKSNRPDKEIDDFIIKSRLGKDPHDVKALWKKKIDENGKVIDEAHLSLDHPISVRAAGESLADVDNLKNKVENFVDGREDYWDPSPQMNYEYTGQKNSILDTVEAPGSEVNPIFKTRQTKTMDAFATLRQSARSILNARYFDDIKIKEVEKFAQEFAHTIKATPEELAHNPLPHILNPEWNPGATRQELAAAKASHYALMTLLGTPTELANNMRFVKRKILDSIFQRLGSKGAEVADPIVSYFTERDPTRFMRHIAFHEKLGLFNPVQLWLQSTVLAHMTAIAGPKAAGKALPAAVMARFLRFTNKPSMIEAMADRVAKLGPFGMRKQDFIEAYDLLRESGMDRVGGEVAMKSDFLDPSIINTKAGKFFDFASIFFTEGDRLGRLGGFMGAYNEWRIANPTAKLTPRVKRAILERADIMSGNMTAKSNGAWQRGLASVPTQFFSFQARLAEQMIGGRLTPIEKAKVFAMYSAMYGLPVGMSAATVWPWGDTIREQLTHQNIPYDDNIVGKALMEGITSLGLNVITGSDYNVGERYGPGGIQTLRDAWNGDLSFKEALLGVSGKSVGDMWNQIMPLATDMASWMSGEQHMGPVLLQDMVRATEEISSVNTAAKTWYALNTGKLMTKNGMVTTDATPMEALFLGLTGLEPRRVGNAFVTQDVLKHEAEIQNQAMTTATRWYQKGARTEDPAEREAYFRRGLAEMEAAGLSPQQRTQVLHRVWQGHENFVDIMSEKFAKSSPERLYKYIQEHSSEGK